MRDELVDDVAGGFTQNPGPVVREVYRPPVATPPSRPLPAPYVPSAAPVTDERVEIIRRTLADCGATSPSWDTDSLAQVIANALDRKW